MFELRFQSDLAAAPDAIWAIVSRMSGVNDELGPFLFMTRDGREDRLFSAEGDGCVRLTSWVLFLRLVPIDRHALEARSEGFGFAEDSHSWLQRIWRHRRRLEAIPGGTRLRDEIDCEPRIGLAAPLVEPIIGAIFRHRHRRLARRFGLVSRDAV